MMLWQIGQASVWPLPSAGPRLGIHILLTCGHGQVVLDSKVKPSSLLGLERLCRECEPRQ